MTQRDEGVKETYIKELGRAVLYYMRTGVRKRQLDILLLLEEEYGERWQEQFDISQIVDEISEKSRNTVTEIVSAEHNNIQREQIDPDIIQEVLSEIVKVVSEIVNEKLQEVLEEAIYLSHINMLYEIYAQEEKLRDVADMESNRTK